MPYQIPRYFLKQLTCAQPKCEKYSRNKSLVVEGEILGMVKRYTENKKGVGIFIDTEMKILDVKKLTNNWEIESMKKVFSFL